MVDGPNSTLYANVSQRTFTLEGFKQLQLDTAKLEERYKEDFHEDPEALLAEFNEMKEVGSGDPSSQTWRQFLQRKCA